MIIKQKTIQFLKNKSSQNFFIYGLGQVFNLLSPLIVAPLIISICHDTGFGKVGLGFAMSLFLILIVDYAFDIKATKSVSENRHEFIKLQELISTTIFTKMSLFFFVLLFSVMIIWLIPFFYIEKKLYFLSIMIVFAQVFNPIWFFQGIENFKWISFINIGSKVTYVSLVLLFINQEQDYVFVNFFLGFSSLFFNILGFFYIKKKYQFQVVVPKLSTIKIILKDDFSFCVSQLFLSARQLSPLLLTSYFLGFSITGQYRVLEQVINLFRTFSQVFLRFFYAKACYKFIEDAKGGWDLWKKYSLYNIIIASLLSIIFFIFSITILRFFHLPEKTILELNWFFRLALIVSFLISLTLPLEQLMFIQNKNKMYIKIAIFVTVINILLLLIFIKKFEILGIIISLIIAEIVFIIFYYYNSFLNTKLNVKNDNNHI